MRILFILLYSGIVLTDSDVSDELKGRLAMLENQDVPQYWSCPSPALTHGAGYQFFPPEYVPQLDLCWNLNQEKAKKKYDDTLQDSRLRKKWQCLYGIQPSRLEELLREGELSWICTYHRAGV